MVVLYAVTPELRIKLKEPFGELIKGSFSQTMAKIKELKEKEKPPKIISVGDTVTKNLHDYGVGVDLAVVDNLCMRKKFQPVIYTAKTVTVKNPPGTITREAIDAIKEALQSQEHIHIVVDGEEDLLTLTAVLYAPENSAVIYGQPYEGIVVVKVTPEKKAKAAEFLKAMEIGSKS